MSVAHRLPTGDIGSAATVIAVIVVLAFFAWAFGGIRLATPTPYSGPPWPGNNNGTVEPGERCNGIGQNPC